MLEQRMREIQQRKLEIRAFLEKDAAADVDALTAELDALEKEYKQLEKRAQIISGLNDGSLTPTPAGIQNPVAPEARALTPDEAAKSPEFRSAWLKALQGKPLTDAEQRAFSTAANSALPIIPESTANAIIKKMYEVAPILARCKIFHIPGNFKFAVEDVRDDATLHTQNANITPASDKLGSVSLTGYEIVKLVKASRASSEMALSAFESYIVEIVAEDVARKIENFIFSGTGNNQPGGVVTAGKGTNGAYTEGTDLKTIAAATAVTPADVTTVYGMLGDGYERNAVWCMRKTTFFAVFYALMDKGKNNLIEFANGKYYIMGCEVYFTGSLAAGVTYFGDFGYIVGNYSQDVNVVKSEHSGLATNSIDYLGSCVFDSKPISGLGAFVKFVKTQGA